MTKERVHMCIRVLEDGEHEKPTHFRVVDAGAYEVAVAELERLQARIDSLMLEYCPDEMTPEQVAEWERHQKVTVHGPRIVTSGEPLACDCPEVCKVCGGRARACALLGHRLEADRSVKWHECKTMKSGEQQ